MTKPNKKYVKSLIAKSLTDSGLEMENGFVDNITEYIVENSISTDGVWRRPLGKHLKDLKGYWEKAAELAEEDPERRDNLIRAYDCLHIQIMEDVRHGKNR